MKLGGIPTTSTPVARTRLPEGWAALLWIVAAVPLAVLAVIAALLFLVAMMVAEVVS